MSDIILASKSNARNLLLSSLGISFKTIPSKINERSIRDKNLSVRAEKLARAKAEKVLEIENGIIIAADTYSELEGEVFEKPRDLLEAKKMLLQFSGKSAVNYTGFCYIDSDNQIDFSTVVRTNYVFRELYESEIDLYVKNFPVTDWAAGFALVKPYITSFIARVEGSYTALAYGLPSEILIPLLKKSGFEPHPQ